MRKLILQTELSLGDVVMLTAAVRDLHRCYPNQFLTDVRTTCAEVWENNPHLTPLDPADPDVEVVRCDYPLIQWSNQVPFHFVHGYIDHLNARLGLEVRATEFRGDLHLSARERRERNPLSAWISTRFPYWLVLAGGKHDVTIKWWDSARYQEVVDQLQGKVQFVQLGQAGHHHPKLRGTIDLRGRTSIRDLVRLVYGCQGVLCGVTGLMHLAAAVPTRRLADGLRPCVVVAGGREPSHWEAYPGHEFLHTIGQLPCCAAGGCWRSRTVPLGDGDGRDRRSNRCVDVVEGLPHCMHLITAREVVGRVQRFFEGGRLRFLNRRELAAAHRAESETQGNPLDLAPLTAANVRPALERFLQLLPGLSDLGRGRGRGIVLCAGGVRYFTCAWVAIRMLRLVGCRLPIELWYLGSREMTSEMRGLLRPWGVRCVDALATARRHPVRKLGGWELKPYALVHSRFEEVLLLDADNVVVRDPEFLFETREFREVGAVFWPDNPGTGFKPEAARLCGLAQAGDRPFETGQLLVDKRRCSKALRVALWMNEHSDFFYPLTHGDKETFRLAFHKVGKSYVMPGRSPDGRMRQYDFRGRLLFQHRNTDKWSLFVSPKRVAGFRYHRECCGFLEDLRQRWTPRIARPLQGVGATRDWSSKPVASGVDERYRRVKAVPNPRGSGTAQPLTIVMLYDAQMACIGELTRPMWERYASRHGYGFVCFEKTLDPERPTAWSKVLAVQRVLEERHMAVMWVDADTLPMNQRVRVDHLIPAACDVAFASDFNGLNTGVFLIRSTSWSLEFLKAVYFLGDVRRNPDGFGDKWEQNTVKAVLQHFKGDWSKVAILPQSVMNSSLETFVPGEFLVHLGALSNRDRLRYVRELERQVID
ncbi:MAG: hypothetical protein JNN07_25845 [Verrucomicrobiales bacterium]|nr:hypothetical protein [Verrucomicrobiales bacterium]